MTDEKIETAEEERKRRRPAGLLLVLGATVAATAVIGFGGLAAWQAVTTNGGNSLSTGKIHHQQLVTDSGGTTHVACDSSVAAGGAACNWIFQATNMKPGSSISGSTKLTIPADNTFQTAINLTEPSAVSSAGSTLCAEATLTITDDASPSNTIYSGALNALASTALKPTHGVAADLGTVNWNASDNTTYTFTATLPSNATVNNDNTAMGATCTIGFQFAQQ